MFRIDPAGYPRAASHARYPSTCRARAPAFLRGDPATIPTPVRGAPRPHDHVVPSEETMQRSRRLFLHNRDHRLKKLGIVAGST
jgi:hypothetical protein